MASIATWYSDHFSTGGSSLVLPNALIRGRLNAPRGTGGTSRKMKRGYIDMSASVPGSYEDDVVLLAPVKSNDRIFDLRFTTDDEFDCATSITMDLGLYDLAEGGGLGAVVVIDCFVDGVDIDGTAANTGRIDAWTSATDLANLDRGKPLWEALDDNSLTTFGSDPQAQWVICATLIVTGAVVTGGKMLLEIEYTDC